MQEMFEEQQRLNAELSMRIEHLVKENTSTHARANYLEDVSHSCIFLAIAAI